MSLSEILVIVILAIFLIKPDDLPSIFRQVRRLFAYFHSMKKELAKEIESIADDGTLQESNDQLNLYLKKIMELDETYNGDYSLSDVKAFYHKLLIQKRIK